MKYIDKTKEIAFIENNKTSCEDMKLTKRLYMKWGYTPIIFHQKKTEIYPSSLKKNCLDCRIPENKPYMLIAFNYIREPEKDEKIISSIEDEFEDLPEFKNMEIQPIREILKVPQEITTCFKEKISLS